MKKAMADASVAPADVDYINAHGTSSVAGDEAEIEALNAVFGPLLEKTWVNATKGLTGHCLYSAGIIEAVAALIQLKRGFVHPNRNLENPIDKNCRFAASTCRMERCRVALNNSFGFGGINSAVVIKALSD